MEIVTSTATIFKRVFSIFFFWLLLIDLVVILEKNNQKSFKVTYVSFNSAKDCMKICSWKVTVETLFILVKDPNHITVHKICSKQQTIFYWIVFMSSIFQNILFITKAYKEWKNPKLPSYFLVNSTINNNEKTQKYTSSRIKVPKLIAWGLAKLIFLSFRLFYGSLILN